MMTLTSQELDLLKSYDPERGRIWDAASLMPGVYSLIEKGLIEPVSYDEATDTYYPDSTGGKACRLTVAGASLAHDSEGYRLTSPKPVD